MKNIKQKVGIASPDLDSFPCVAEVRAAQGRARERGRGRVEAEQPPRPGGRERAAGSVRQVDWLR